MVTSYENSCDQQMFRQYNSTSHKGNVINRFLKSKLFGKVDTFVFL